MRASHNKRRAKYSIHCLRVLGFLLQVWANSVRFGRKQTNPCSNKTSGDMHNINQLRIQLSHILLDYIQSASLTHTQLFSWHSISPIHALTLPQCPIVYWVCMRLCACTSIWFDDIETFVLTAQNEPLPFVFVLNYIMTLFICIFFSFFHSVCACLPLPLSLTQPLVWNRTNVNDGWIVEIRVRIIFIETIRFCRSQLQV